VAKSPSKEIKVTRIRSKRLSYVLVGIASVFFCWGIKTLSAATPPELPRVYIDTTMPDTSGYAVVNVGASGNLQAAIDNASCGTVIKLLAGATYTGNFVLRDKGDCKGRWIVITTSQEAQLPPPGTRIKPSDAPNMARLIDPKVYAPVLRSEGAANHYRLIGLEITSTLTATDKLHFYLTYFGNDKAYTADKLPHHIYVDRVTSNGKAVQVRLRGTGN
jgi:hypothetical protein